MHVIWREMFDSYANPVTREIDVSNATKFVTDVCERNNLMHDSDTGSSVLQCVAVCCSVWQCVTVCGSVWQCVAVCGSVLQCVAV